MSRQSFPSYVPAATRRANATKAVNAQKKKGTAMMPVAIKGRMIASTFWGKKWCQHFESFSDYENRLPRGRTYVRNGSVIDLQIGPGEISAQVIGSSLYRQKITVKPLAASRWKTLTQSCAGRVDSLVELLQGGFSEAVMDVLCRPQEGLLPCPAEIQMACSCPDWASLCKHLAAVLYGVGARLDTQPELLFVLRNTDPEELLVEAASSQAVSAGESELDGDALSEIFGVDIAPVTAALPEAKPKRPKKATPKKKSTAKTAPRKASAKRSPEKGSGEKPMETPLSKRKGRKVV